MITKTKLIFLFLISAVGFSLMSCRLGQSNSPSVIVIAVDHLGVNQLGCTSEASPQMRSGIALLCQESIRFTHAFTTSPLSGPALTSLLTAQYPYEHGLRSNTKSFLPSRVTTIPEMAQQQGWATSFFSGGAPVLRKLNLQQGFETFDDAFNPTSNHLFRSFQKTQKIFEAWLHEIGHQNFFSVFYVPDMAFINTPTQTVLGENRNLSYESQLEEFDDALYTFIKDLKSRKLWDSTLIVLVGLNGPNVAIRSDELSNLNLYSEKTQVGLLIKPAQKPRDQGINWSFDENVTLADVGATLADIFGGTLKDSKFPILSLKEVLKSPSPQLETDRPILIESAWSDSHGIRYAIRWGQYLFLLDEKLQVYNSLIDRQETSPIRINESGTQQEWEQIQKILASQQWKLWPGLSRDEYLKWKGLSDLWSIDPNLSKSTSFERLAHRLRDINEVTELYSRELLNQQNWPELLRWAQGLKLKDMEKIALRNLKKDTSGVFVDPCLAILEKNRPQNSDLKKCEDPISLSLVEWALSEKSDLFDTNVREALKKRFLRQYVLYRLDRKIVETNYALQGTWDLGPNLRSKGLTLDMMMALPEMQKFKQIALKTFQQTRED